MTSAPLQAFISSSGERGRGAPCGHVPIEGGPESVGHSPPCPSQGCPASILLSACLLRGQGAGGQQKAQGHAAKPGSGHTARGPAGTAPSGTGVWGSGTTLIHGLAGRAPGRYVGTPGRYVAHLAGAGGVARAPLINRAASSPPRCLWEVGCLLPSGVCEELPGADGVEPTCLVAMALPPAWCRQSAEVGHRSTATSLVNVCKL